MNYELPEIIGQAMHMEYEKFDLPPCGGEVPVIEAGKCIPVPWNHVGAKLEFLLEWEFGSPPPTDACTYWTTAGPTEGVVLPGMAQAWTMTTTASFNGLELPSTSETISVQVYPGFSPP
jgi:hypothetical protein